MISYTDNTIESTSIYSNNIDDMNYYPSIIRHGFCISRNDKRSKQVLFSEQLAEVKIINYASEVSRKDNFYSAQEIYGFRLDYIQELVALRQQQQQLQQQQKQRAFNSSSDAIYHDEEKSSFEEEHCWREEEQKGQESDHDQFDCKLSFAMPAQR